MTKVYHEIIPVLEELKFMPRVDFQHRHEVFNVLEFVEFGLLVGGEVVFSPKP